MQGCAEHAAGNGEVVVCVQMDEGQAVQVEEVMQFLVDGI